MTSDSLASAWRSAESQLSGELAQAGQSSLTTAFLSGYLPELKNTIDNGWSQYSSGLREYNEGLREYNEGLAQS